MFFCAEVHPIRRQKSRHVTPRLQCGNHQWRKCEPDVKKWWVSATRLESRLVTWCLWTNGRIGCKRFLMDQSRRVVSQKTRRLQWLFYFNALSLPNHVCIHIREIYEWAFTDGVTTFVNMWLCCRQALIFWLINFDYFAVWCLPGGLTLTHKCYPPRVFFLGGDWGGPPIRRKFCQSPPSDTCPRFWTKACPPPAEVRPRKFEKFKYIFVSNLTTFKLKSTLKSCISCLK